MDKSVLDSDIFSEVLKGRDRAVAEKAHAYERTFGRLTITSLTVLEITKGLHKARRPERLAAFLSRLSAVEVLPLDGDSAALAGEISAELERAGEPIGRADPMIAAIAIRAVRTLVTGNTRHFERIRAIGFPLMLMDWRA